MEINGIVAERFLFAPSIGFAIVLTFILFKITKTAANSNSIKLIKTSLKYIIILIVVVFAIKTAARNTSWKDSLTLYRNDIHYLDKSVKANDILAQEMMDKVMREIPLKKSLWEIKPALDSIIFLYNRSLSLFPGNPKALNNVANIYINFFNKPDIALGYLQKAYRYKKNSFEIIYNLAQCCEMLKNDDSAAFWYNAALKLDAKYPKVWDNLIKIYYRTGMPDSAKTTCERMLLHDTLSDVPYIGLGYYYISKKDTLIAIKNWEKAVKNNPQNYERCISLSKYFTIHKDTLKAKFYYQKAIEAKMYKQN